MTLKEAVSLVKTSLENTAIATVKSLKSHVFKVDIGKKEFAITNWPKKQIVEGKVAVVDLEKLEKQLVQIAEWQKTLEESLRDLSAKDTVKVANFPEFPSFPEFPTSTKLAGEVKVSSDSFSSLLVAIEELSKLVAKLPTRYPEVKIPPFPRVEIPPFPKIPEPLSEVSVKNLERLISKDPQRYVPVRLSDGKRFYQAIEELTVSASRAQAFSDSQGVKQQALVDKDRHVQVDVLTMPQVIVSNPTADPETGLAKEAKQDEIVAELGKKADKSTTPIVYNLTLANANTEYSQELPAHTKELRFRCRTLYDVRYAWVAGKVATPTTPYLTLPAGCDYWSDRNDLSSRTLYFASSTAGVVIEMEVFT